MRTLGTTDIIQQEFSNTYKMWRNTQEELKACRRERKVLEQENDMVR